MVRVQAPRFEREVRGLGPRRERQKPPEELVVAGLFALLEDGCGVIGVCKIALAVITSDMAGDALVTLGEAKPVGRGFARQGLAREVGWDGRAVGLQGDANLPGGSPLPPRGNSEGRQRERGQRGSFLVPQVGGVLPGCAVPPDSGYGLKPLLSGRMQDTDVGDGEPGKDIFFHIPPPFSTRPFSFPLPTLHGTLRKP